VDEGTRREMLALLPRLRRFACGLTGSTDEGDDLVQATVERAIRHIDKWQPGTRLDSWMFQIARNLNLNNIRARKVRGGHLAPVPFDDIPGDDGSRIAESRLTVASVRQFVGRLPEEQRTALMLVCVEGLSYREAAQIMDVPVGTVTSRLARARIALRTMIDGTGAPAEAASDGRAEEDGDE
jgi:RNA polymerase sigma-70 factor (ECF subfamily)